MKEIQEKKSREKRAGKKEQGKKNKKQSLRKEKQNKKSRSARADRLLMLQSGFEPESSARKAGMIGLYTTEAFDSLMQICPCMSGEHP